MSDGWSFYALGNPAPQGSKRHVGGGRMIESSKRLPAWRDTVTAAAYGAGPKLDGPLHAMIVFSLPKPQRAKKTDIYADHGIDLDKAVRAVFDAVTAAGLWADDARVVGLRAAKLYAGGLAWALPVPGVVMSCTAGGDHNLYLFSGAYEKATGIWARAASGSPEEEAL